MGGTFLLVEAFKLAACAGRLQSGVFGIRSCVGVIRLRGGAFVTSSSLVCYGDAGARCSQANAVGRNSKSLREFLEERYKPELSEDETVKLAIRTLMEVRLDLMSAAACKPCSRRACLALRRCPPGG